LPSSSTATRSLRLEVLGDEGGGDGGEITPDGADKTDHKFWTRGGSHETILPPEVVVYMT
jgi:hypothetical protein